MSESKQSKADKILSDLVIQDRASKQDQYNDTGDDYIYNFGSYFDWRPAQWSLSIDKRPQRSPDNRGLDKWIINAIEYEPHLPAVIAQIRDIVSSRPFQLVGGRNGVNRAKSILNGANRPEGSRVAKGYRNFIGKLNYSYNVTGMGGVVEVGRMGDVIRLGNVEVAQPMNAVWSGDPTMFKLNNDIEFPLSYMGVSGEQKWRDADFFRVAADESVLEKDLGIGFPPALKAMELAQILIAVYQHDKEALGAQAPKGLLLLEGVDQESWQAAMKKRKEDMTEKQWKFFGGLFVLASDPGVALDAKLIALSQMPTNFSREQFTELIMYFYALCFGYPPEEFWPVRGSSFQSRSAEVETGMQRAKSKGENGFLDIFRDAFQARLPASVQMMYDERDQRGDKLNADTHKVYADIASTLYQAGLGNGEPLLKREQALQYLVENRVIPSEFSEAVEDVVATDKEEARVSQLRSWARSQTTSLVAAKRTPDEPYVCYRWSPFNPAGTMITLWDRCDHLVKPHLWAGASIQGRATNYEKGEVEITDKDHDLAVEELENWELDDYAGMIEASVEVEDG